MCVIIGSHFVPLEGMFLLIALVIVRITLYNYGLHEKLITLSRCIEVRIKIYIKVY
jgi:hypothetical protein